MRDEMERIIHLGKTDPTSGSLRKHGGARLSCPMRRDG
ncbi:hypothetical protein THTE_3217 [Thermogutta terrifontis]|uniref:Uncharacterized protein n=1 Tax=Thermogutta terrifontis TaxID=1331910 RepID=A0A286RIN0_9BACT|nr:hypothetical protein THTE_3217 [Thermogutta terrifontis]